MPIDDPLLIAALGVGGALVAFELVVAVASWFEARAIPAPIVPVVTFHRATTVRAHFASSRGPVQTMRRDCVPLRSSRYGQQLRREIRGRIAQARLGRARG